MKMYKVKMNGGFNPAKDKHGMLASDIELKRKYVMGKEVVVDEETYEGLMKAISDGRCILIEEVEEKPKYSTKKTKSEDEGDE